jgi:isoleucyl-tRNA synthetase
MSSIFTRVARQQHYSLRTPLTKSYLALSYRALSTTTTSRLTATTLSQLPKNDSNSIERQYSGTLHLPRTDFPLRANAAKRDPQFRERCTDKLYIWQVIK